MILPPLSRVAQPQSWWYATDLRSAHYPLGSLQMPYLTHSRLTWTGVLGLPSAVAETFSFGLTLGGIPGPNPGDAVAYAAAGKAMFNRVESLVCDNAFITSFKLATIGPDGKYVGNPTVVAVDGGVGAAAGPNHPFQISTCISLSTGVRGRSMRGRFYLPAPAVSVIKLSGLMNAGEQQAIAGSMKVFLDAVNAVHPLSPISICSRKGFNTNVNGLRVGRALDTMRSRRRNLPETYLSLPLA